MFKVTQLGNGIGHRALCTGAGALPVTEHCIPVPGLWTCRGGCPHIMVMKLSEFT